MFAALGLVVRRQHLLHAGRRLHALRAIRRACSTGSPACSSSASSGRPWGARGPHAGRGGSGRFCRTCSCRCRSSSCSGGCKASRSSPGSDRTASTLDWYDTDWLAATAGDRRRLLTVAIRRRLDAATSLVLHLAVGWWAGFAHPGPRAGPAHDPAPRRQLGRMPGDDRRPRSGIAAGPGSARSPAPGWSAASSAGSASPPRRCSSWSR